jgi:peptidoglycan-N-acetylglucosamine deacetylase
MPKLTASLSLDLDNKWSYLKTHGERGWESFPSYLGTVVPRFLTVLRELQLPSTVFVVGQDAALAKNHAVLAEIPAAGHEVGNHSFHHEPWLHLYSSEQLEDELSLAEEAIEDATGERPRGFRGPGFSLSAAVVASLIRRGYQYDASTLPTFLGPLARSYYFFTARLSKQQRTERKQLFGSWSEGLRPVKPYWWEVVEERANQPLRRTEHCSVLQKSRLLEIPVTTMPLSRTPIHVSYLLFLKQRSSAAAWTYWRLAMRMCQMAGVGPSLLLHPLDFLGGDEERDLDFFPAMRMPTAKKVRFVREVLADFSARFSVLPLCEHAALLAASANLPVRRLSLPAGQQPNPRVEPVAETPAIAAEVARR